MVSSPEDPRDLPSRLAPSTFLELYFFISWKLVKFCTSLRSRKNIYRKKKAVRAKPIRISELENRLLSAMSAW